MLLKTNDAVYYITVIVKGKEKFFQTEEVALIVQDKDLIDMTEVDQSLLNRKILSKTLELLPDGSISFGKEIEVID